MGLNVQWRWSMPQQGNPDQVAQGNRDSLMSGLDSLAAGLLKRGENKREQQKFDQAQSNWEKQFEAQEQQRRLNNIMQTKQFEEQQRMNNQALANQQHQLQKSQEQQQWMQKFYDEFFGNDDEYQELKKLRAQFSNQTSQLPQETSDSALIMMGLNPLLR